MLKNLSFIIALLLSVANLTSCSSNDEPQIKTDDFDLNQPSKPRVDIQLSRSETDMINNLTNFSFTALHNIASENNDNIIFSPLSLSTALSMLANGAEGETLNEYLTLLNTENLDELNQLNKKLLNKLPELDNNVRFHSANALFHNDVKIYNDFSSTLNNYYKAEQFNVDLSTYSGLDILNRWCYENTWGMIPKFSEYPLLSVISLFNATAFMGRWETPFDESATNVGNFTNENGVKQQAYMMNQDDLKSYYKGTGYQATTLSYGNGAFLFTVILPDIDNTVDNVLTGFEKEGINSCENLLGKTAEVKLSLPRFKINNKFRLNSALHSLGLKTALSKDSDYSKISAVEIAGLIVEQASAIEVFEQGTKAAAVTGGELMTDDYSNHLVKVEFKVDRPFIYVIHERSTGTILFLGVVRNMN